MAGAQTVQQTAPPLPVLVIADANGPSWLDSQRMYYRLLYADAQQSRPYAYNRWNTPPLQLLSQRLKTRIAQGGVKVLATTEFPTPGADGPHVPNGRVIMPQVWTKMYGKGRIFYNALGHHEDIFDNPPALELMRRGFRWAAR